MSKIQSSLHIPVSKEGLHKNRSTSHSDGITVGVTGTRYTKKITPVQVRQLRILLEKVYDRHSSNGECWLAHGDCVGWDEIAHDIARTIGYRICIYPPERHVYRAFCNGADEMVQPQPYFVRNQDIVRASDYLLIGPTTNAEIQRTGEWQTYRYARRRKVPHTIIYPNGRMEGEGWKEVLRSVSPS